MGVESRGGELQNVRSICLLTSHNFILEEEKNLTSKRQRNRHFVSHSDRMQLLSEQIANLQHFRFVRTGIIETGQLALKFKVILIVFFSKCSSYADVIRIESISRLQNIKMILTLTEQILSCESWTIACRGIVTSIVRSPAIGQAREPLCSH